MEHVVITGGLGFIGCHLADEYLRRGDRVTLIDSLVSSVTEGTEYREHPGCVVVEASVEEYLGRGSFDDADRVLHAASLVGPAGILPYTGRLGADITRTTALVVEECLRAATPLCLFSSAEIYGRSGLLSEEDEIRVPAAYNTRIEYALGKLLGEAITINSLSRGLRAIVIRPFNVSGPRQSSAGGYVVPTFVQQALAGQDITVFATGEQERAFLAVSDLVDFVGNFMDSALSNGTRRIYNLGNQANRTSINNLAHMVKRLTASESQIVHVDAKEIHGPLYEEAESFQKLPAPGVAQELGWLPLASLDELIKATISYYRTESDWRAAQIAG